MGRSGATRIASRSASIHVGGFMRQVGTLLKEQDAYRFADYLLTQGITVHAEPDGDEWVIWVRDEDHLDRAEQELENFSRAPDDRRYRDVASAAQSIRHQEVYRREQTRKNLVEMRGRWKGAGVPRRSPLVFLMIGACVLVALMAGLDFNVNNAFYRLLLFRDPAPERIELRADDDVLRDVNRGEVWRLITPVFVHGGVWHLVFNMYWLYFLGGQVEGIRGSLRLLIFVLAAAVISMVAQAYIESPYAGGMSGVNYALFGYVWMRWRFEPAAGFLMNQSTVIIMTAWFFFCFTGWAGPIANTAHAFGFGLGIAVGYAPEIFRR